jgi:hypothetical protein
MKKLIALLSITSMLILGGCDLLIEKDTFDLREASNPAFYGSYELVSINLKTNWDGEKFLTDSTFQVTEGGHKPDGKKPIVSMALSPFDASDPTSARFSVNKAVIYAPFVHFGYDFPRTTWCTQFGDCFTGTFSTFNKEKITFMRNTDRAGFAVEVKEINSTSLVWVATQGNPTTGEFSVREVRWKKTK